MKSIKIVLKALFILLLGGNLSALYAQANITVNASSTLLTIPSEVYGTNMSTYTSSNNGSDPAYVTAMQVSGSRNIRWPGGSYADFVNWNDLQCQGSFEVTTPEYISFLQKFGGQMQAIVNFSGKWCGTQYTHAQAVSLAAAWVSWNLTNTGSARAKYWEIGNEVYGSWETGGQGSAGSTLTGTVYGNYFADYYKAMKAVDPTIQIGAVASPGASDYNNWTPNMLTSAKAAGVVPDFLIIHNYPDGATGTGAAFDATMLSYTTLPASFTSSLNSLVASDLGSSYVGQVKYFMTEYNSGGPGGPNVQCNEYINAMFVSQWIMECAQNGWIGANLWAAKNGGTPDYGFINSSTDAPFPDYYVFPMLTGKFGAGMVSCSSSNSGVRSYASKDSAGNLTLFMVNNNPTTSMPANVTVSGFAPASSGQAWVMLPSGTSSSGAPQEAPSISINGNVNPAPANIASIAGTALATGSSFTVNLQPSEMALIVIPPSGGTPQPTPTNTPCAPTAIIPYLQVNAGTWQATNSVTVSAGATVNLGPQPLTGGTWSWTGPSGFTSASREIDGIPLSVGTNTFVATYTNPCGSKSTETFTITITAPNTSTPTATFTPTVTRTNTAVPPTSTFTATSTATRTNTLTATPSSTATRTPVPPTSTFTAVFTHTNTPVPPTATSTNSPVPPTVTNTPLPPTFTSTSTNTAVPPTATNTLVPSTVTDTNTPMPPTTTFTPSQTATPFATSTAVPPTFTSTATDTAVPPTFTNTPVPPTLTFTSTRTSTSTPVPPTATNTPVPTNTPTFTFTPTPLGSGSLTLYLMSAVTTDSTNSPHPQIEVVNTGSGPLNLNNVEVRYWFNCDCTNQSIQTWVDWAGLMPAGTSVTGDVLHTSVPTSMGGQTNYVSYKFTGNLVLQPGQMIQVQSRFNKSDWSNMLQDNDWSFAPYTSFTQWTHITGYLNGTLVWGQEPSGTSSALKAASVIAYPNPSTGNGVNLAVNLSGNGTGTTASTSTKAKLVTGSSTETGVDPNAQITLKVYTIDGRLIWSTTVSGASIGSTGNHAVYWNEKDLSGANLANGLYIVAATVKSNGQTSTAFSKLMILK